MIAPLSYPDVVKDFNSEVKLICEISHSVTFMDEEMKPQTVNYERGEILPRNQIVSVIRPKWKLYKED